MNTTKEMSATYNYICSSIGIGLTVYHTTVERKPKCLDILPSFPKVRKNEKLGKNGIFTSNWRIGGLYFVHEDYVHRTIAVVMLPRGDESAPGVKMLPAPMVWQVSVVIRK